MPENNTKQNTDASVDVVPLNDTPTKPSRRRWLRRLLLMLGPLLVLAVGAYVYMNTSRYIETDNAYVKAETVTISAEVAGPITHIAVRENEYVQKGDVLFEIDDRLYRVAVERAEAQLEAVQAFIVGLQASYRKRLEELKLAQTNVIYAEREFARVESLAQRHIGSEVDLDRVGHELDVAKQQIQIIEQSLAQLRAQLGGHIDAGLESHPAYRTVLSIYNDAMLDLEHTIVRAPFAGVASRVPIVGRYVTSGGPVMSIVSSHDVWVEANYKETELTHVETGQTVTVILDTYPGRSWQGIVESISPVTGAEFSVIPAQNASGNWVKVAQRIPVRIALKIAPGDPPLRAGMSAIVEIDTHYAREVPAILSFLRVLEASEPVRGGRLN